MNELFDRRTVLAGIGAIAALQMLGPAGAIAAPRTRMLMWHAPGCGCCLEWVKRVEATFGGRMTVAEVGDMAAIKRARNVPEALWSCHTASIGGVIVEGHVPPEDIRRAARARVHGLAVPGMPLGSPGMDVGHNHREPYLVFAFTADGRRSVFASHG
jgi:hypothetical protein